MATGGPPGPYIAVTASNLTTTFTPGCRDTGTTVGGMRVYEMPSMPYEMVTVAPMATGDHGVSATNTPMQVIDCGQYDNDHPYWRWTTAPATTHTITTWPAEPQRLPDEDVRRIAREVVRQMARADHDPGDED